MSRQVTRKMYKTHYKLFMVLHSSAVSPYSCSAVFFNRGSAEPKGFVIASMGGTRIFELGGQRGVRQNGGKENCCYRTFNWGKLEAGALSVNDRKLKEIQHWQCSVLTHFVDFYINFTLRQWTGRVEKAQIIFFLTMTGGQPGDRA